MLRIPLPSAAHSGAYIPEDDGFALAVPREKARRNQGRQGLQRHQGRAKKTVIQKSLGLFCPFVPSHTAFSQSSPPARQAQRCHRGAVRPFPSPCGLGRISSSAMSPFVRLLVATLLDSAGSSPFAELAETAKASTLAVLRRSRPFRVVSVFRGL